MVGFSGINSGTLQSTYIGLVALFVADTKKENKGAVV